MKQKGFTLIELIIVVAILAIIATIAGNFLSNGASARAWMQNGSYCENGLQWSVSHGYSQQVIGANGLPQTCQGG